MGRKGGGKKKDPGKNPSIVERVLYTPEHNNSRGARGRARGSIKSPSVRVVDAGPR